jgi:hypothetical protein
VHGQRGSALIWIIRDDKSMEFHGINKNAIRCKHSGHQLRKFKDTQLAGVNLGDVTLAFARDLYHRSQCWRPRAARRLPAQGNLHMPALPGRVIGCWQGVAEVMDAVS